MKYNKPEIELERFKSVDVITASGEEPSTPENPYDAYRADNFVL